MEKSFHDSFVGFVGKSPNPLRSIRKSHGTVHAGTPGIGPRESQQPALVPLRSIRVPRRDSAALANEQGRNDNSPLRSIRMPRRDSSALAKGQGSNENNFAPKPQSPPQMEVPKNQEPTPFDK